LTSMVATIVEYCEGLGKPVRKGNWSVRSQIDMTIDQFDFSAEIVIAVGGSTMNFDNLRHARCTCTGRAGHDINHLVRPDRLVPRHSRPFDMKFERLTRVLRPKAYGSIIFRDRNICIVKIARIEHDGLRIDLRPADAELIRKGEIRSSHEWTARTPYPALTEGVFTPIDWRYLRTLRAA